jgi:hypothetical protein
VPPKNVYVYFTPYPYKKSSTERKKASFVMCLTFLFCQFIMILLNKRRKNDDAKKVSLPEKILKKQKNSGSRNSRKIKSALPGGSLRS